MLRLVGTAFLTAILCAAQASAQTADVRQQQADAVASTSRCPAEPAPEIVEIREADPVINPAHHELMRKTLVEKIKQANATILLGPKVVIDFSDAPHLLPLEFEKPCVTLTSVAAFPPRTTGPIFSGRTTGFTRRLAPGDVIDFSDLVAEQPRPEQPVGSARTPSSPVSVPKTQIRAYW